MAKHINILFVKLVLSAFLLSALSNQLPAQLKFVVEDFEGFADGFSASENKANGIFTFGNLKSVIDSKITVKESYLGNRCIKLSQQGKLDYGGWGKGIGSNIELDPTHDYLNFYINQPTTNKNNLIKIELQEDDSGDNAFEKNLDDSWNYVQKLENSNTWTLLSIPLNKFKDANQGGDGIFNINYKQGQLLCIIISFIKLPPASIVADTSKINQIWYFDFICFSKDKLPTGIALMNSPLPAKDDFCSLGTWSKEGNMAHFSDIALNFENNFKNNSEKKLGVVHFFQSFAFDGGSTQNQYPSVERINKVIHEGYVPMITLEDHFVNTDPKVKQPNLYSIVEGYFDSFFKDWAKEIKQVDGIVLLRILHEFNGDWYPWCTVNNDKNPLLLIKAFQHIYTIFQEQQVTNVKFIWCPNSTSFPQERWNYIMNAYPGDAFVDYIGLDVYNGAGKGLPVWRSFRKEGIENYFTITQHLPHKPLFICETASRERTKNESPSAQNKAEWIRQMSEALKTDMSKIRLLTWFNEKESFKINSSTESQNAYLNYILKDDYFKSGAQYMYPILQH